MPKRLNSLIFLAFIGLGGLPAAPAFCAAIVNLSDAAGTFELETAQGYVPVEIAAGSRYFVPGKARFRFKGREIMIEHHEEYALWPGDVFGPQRRLRSLLPR